MPSCIYKRGLPLTIKKGTEGLNLNPSVPFLRYYGGLNHNDIAKEFERSNVGSASYPINRIKKEIEDGGWKKEI